MYFLAVVYVHTWEDVNSFKDAAILQVGQPCAHARIDGRECNCEDSIADRPLALARQWSFRDETNRSDALPPRRFRRIFRAKSEATAKSEKPTSVSSEVGIPTLADSHCLRNCWRGSAGQARQVGQCQDRMIRMIRMIRMTRRAGVSGAETGTNHFLVAARVEFRVEFRRELRELRSDCSDSCKLRCAKARTQNIAPFSLEGVS